MRGVSLKHNSQSTGLTVNRESPELIYSKESFIELGPAHVHIMVSMEMRQDPRPVSDKQMNDPSYSTTLFRALSALCQKVSQLLCLYPSLSHGPARLHFLKLCSPKASFQLCSEHTVGISMLQ